MHMSASPDCVLQSHIFTGANHTAAAACICLSYYTFLVDVILGY